MSFVGKKFPSITVDAMSEMGDDLKINVFEEAVKKRSSIGYLYELMLQA